MDGATVTPRRETYPARRYRREGRYVMVWRILSSSSVMGVTEVEVEPYTLITCETDNDAIALMEDLFWGEDG